MNASSACAQFLGSFTIGGYRSTNVEGQDSATPDIVFNPSIELQYNWDVSDPTALSFDAMLTPNLYQDVGSRSYVKTFFSIAGSFYLSDIGNADRRTSKSAIVSLDQALPTKIKTTAGLIDTTVEAVILRPAIQKVSANASEMLVTVSELLDSFEIDRRSLSEDSIEISTDLKDSISETILALSDILTTQIFSESISNVVTTEVFNQKQLVQRLPLKSAEKAQLDERLDHVLDFFKDRIPQSDILPMPKANSPTELGTRDSVEYLQAQRDEILLHALAHLQSESGGEGISSAEKAPIITLINSQTELKDFNSLDIETADNIDPLTKKTLATLLSAPLSIEAQSNKGAYADYSFWKVDFHPRFDLYWGKSFALGTSLDLTRTKFLYDSTRLNNGIENKLRLDGRIDVTPWMVFVPELGIGFKSFDRSIQYSTLVSVKGRPLRPDTVIVNTPTDYRHILFGGSVIFFPTGGFSFGIAGAFIRSATLRPYLFDSLLTQKSTIGGTVSDDEYAFDLTRESFFLLWDAFWGARLSFDIAYENRHYANVEIGRSLSRLPITTIQRDDQGPVVGLDISRVFLFDSRLIGILNSFTPSINFQYTNYTSSVSQFNYEDLTTAISLTFEF